MFDNPKIKILYTIVDGNANEELMSPEKKREDPYSSQSRSMGNKTYESEDIAAKRKLEE